MAGSRSTRHSGSD